MFYNLLNEDDQYFPGKSGEGGGQKSLIDKQNIIYLWGVRFWSKFVDDWDRTRFGGTTFL